MDKTKAELRQEIIELRQRVAELAALDAARRMAEEALQTAEETWRSWVANAPETITLLDHDGKILFINRTVGKFTPQQVMQTSIYDYLPPEQQNKLREALNVLFAEGSVQRFEVAIPRPDGAQVWYENNIDPIWQNNRVVSALIFARNITARKQMENALQESEIRYREMFENVPVPLLEEDFSAVKAYIDDLRQQGVTDFRAYFESHPEVVAHCSGLVKIIAVNRATLALQQVNEQQDAQTDFPATFSAETYAAFREELIALASGQFHFADEFTVKTFQGRETLIHFLLAVAPGYEDTWSSVLVSVIDLTRRQQVEAALRARTTEISLLYEAGRQLTNTLEPKTVYNIAYQIIARVMTCDGLYVSSYDPLAKQIHCVAAWQDDQALAIQQFPPIPLEPEGCGTQSRTIHTGESLNLADYQAYLATAQTKYFVTNTGAIVDQAQIPPDAPCNRSALIVPLKIENRVIGVIQVFSYQPAAYDESDLHFLEALAPQITAAIVNANLYHRAQTEIDARDRAQKALRASEERYRIISEVTSDYAFADRIESDGRRITEWVTGSAFRITGLLPEEWDSLAAWEKRLHPDDQALIQYSQQKLLAGQPDTLEFRIRQPNGETRWLRRFARPVWDEKQHRVTHIYGTGQDITELKQAEQQRLELAVEKERVQLLSDFITQAAHQFRTPLAIIGTSLYLLGKNHDTDGQQRHLQQISDQVDHIANLVCDLIVMSGLDSGDPLFSFTAVDLNEIIRVVKETTRTISQQKQLQITALPNSESLWVRGDPGHLKDAVGRIWDNAIRYTPEQGTVTVRAYAQANQGIIEIRDTGVGISDRHLPHIFERFYRADEAGTTRGFGLGLSIAKAIIEKHGGRIEVASQFQQGSTFRVILPLTRITPS